MRPEVICGSRDYPNPALSATALLKILGTIEKFDSSNMILL